MEIDELEWNFDKISPKEKIKFIVTAEKKMALEITNEIIKNHKEFAVILSIVGEADKPHLTLDFWEKYWKNSKTPDYAELLWLSLFLAEVHFRVNEEKKFAQELEAFSIPKDFLEETK